MCGLRNDKTNGETNSPFEYSHCLILFHFVNGNHLFLTKPIITSHLSQSSMISLLIRVSTHDFYHYWGSTSKCHIAHLLYHHSAGKTHYLWQKRATANINFLLPTLPLNDDYLTSAILRHKLILLPRDSNLSTTPIAFQTVSRLDDHNFIFFHSIKTTAENSRFIKEIW